MNLDEIDEELFRQILNKFLEKHENGREILKDVHSLHLELRRKIFVTHYPSHHIVQYILEEKLETPIQEGGYLGMPVKEIAEREGLSISGTYSIINSWLKKRGKK
jgi:hypothetical protein